MTAISKFLVRSKFEEKTTENLNEIWMKKELVELMIF